MESIGNPYTIAALLITVALQLTWLIARLSYPQYLKRLGVVGQNVHLFTVGALIAGFTWIAWVPVTALASSIAGLVYFVANSEA